jgi:hypothetical protein
MCASACLRTDTAVNASGFFSSSPTLCLAKASVRAARSYADVTVGFWDFWGLKAASLFRLHESEVWQGLYRLVVEVF